MRNTYLDLKASEGGGRRGEVGGGGIKGPEEIMGVAFYFSQEASDDVVPEAIQIMVGLVDGMSQICYVIGSRPKRDY